VHPPSLAPRRDDASAPQIREVARNLRLTDPEHAYEVADANFAVGDQIQQAETRGIGEGAKQMIERSGVPVSGHGEIIQHIRLDIYEREP